MCASSKRTYVQTATAETTLAPKAVYDAVADLKHLPQWWFGDDPQSKIWDGTRVPREVGNAGMLARPGRSVDIVCSGAKNHVLGKKRWTEHPSVLRFTCELAQPHDRLRLRHEHIHGTTWRVKTTTEVRLSTARGLTSVTLDQTTEPPERGFDALLYRGAQRVFSFDFQAENTLKDLLQLAEHQAASSRPAPDG